MSRKKKKQRVSWERSSEFLKHVGKHTHTHTCKDKGFFPHLHHHFLFRLVAWRFWTSRSCGWYDIHRWPKDCTLQKCLFKPHLFLQWITSCEYCRYAPKNCFCKLSVLSYNYILLWFIIRSPLSHPQDSWLSFEVFFFNTIWRSFYPKRSPLVCWNNKRTKKYCTVNVRVACVMFLENSDK